MDKRLRQILSRRAEAEYKAYLRYLTAIAGTDLWQHRNRLYVYGSVQEYIQHGDSLPGELARHLLTVSNILEQVWNQYVTASEVSVDTWGGIEALMWHLLPGETKYAMAAGGETRWQM